MLIDTNILARLLLNDIPDHHARVVALFEHSLRNDVKLLAPSSVFIELAYLLSNTKGMPKDEAAAMPHDVITLPALAVEHVTAVESALRFWSHQGPLSYVDCYHLALTRELGITEICTFDQKMDRFPGGTPSSRDRHGFILRQRTDGCTEDGTDAPHRPYRADRLRADGVRPHPRAGLPCVPDP